MRLNEVIRMGPESYRTSVLIRRGRDTRDLSPTLHLCPEESPLRTQQDDGRLQPRREFAPESNPAATVILDFQTLEL